MMKPLLFIVFLLCSMLRLGAAENRIAVVQTFSADSDSVYVHVALPADTAAQSQVAPAPSRENVKLVAAILAFPFPFGMIGLHRIYLGTKPWVPIVYLCTLGGCFGVLPFIDFVVILIQDEEGLKQYQNNDKVFMWVK
ncbi:MAG: TM2 domain-containing protein [Bacteroidia bacterium]|jgi:TM2 domain-containing membrane protein YozV|nr:TM2 domain-containing protein [Bacteroidia bacterium]